MTALAAIDAKLDELQAQCRTLQATRPEGWQRLYMRLKKTCGDLHDRRAAIRAAQYRAERAAIVEELNITILAGWDPVINQQQPRDGTQ